MRVFRRSKFQRHLVIPLMLVCFMAACHKWVALASPLERTLAEHHGKMRLTLEAGHRIEVDSVYVARDSVFWRAHHDMGLGATRSGFSVPLSDVAKAEVRKSDVVGTVGLVVGIGFAASLAVGIFFNQCWQDPSICSYVDAAMPQCCGSTTLALAATATDRDCS